jgi:hypothetical protein
MDELMQSLVQSAQGQGPNVQVLQLSAHLSQTESQGTPTPDLGIHVIPNALIGTQQTVEVDADTAAAFTPNTRQMNGQ